jgi:nucleotide-binding universal stress UspA family protein
MTNPKGKAHGIVVGVDGSPSSLVALEWAARQAELTGSKLQAVAIWHWPASFGYSALPDVDFDPAGEAGAMLEGAVELVRKTHPDIEIQCTVAEGYAPHLLVELSREAELLVVGNRGHGEFVGMLVGSVSEHCVAHAHCPVLVLRGEGPSAPATNCVGGGTIGG